jgi:hypothetical protein
LQAIAVCTSDDTATVSTGNAEMVLSVTDAAQISPSTAEVIVAEDLPAAAGDAATVFCDILAIDTGFTNISTMFLSFFYLFRSFF